MFSTALTSTKIGGIPVISLIVRWEMGIYSSQEKEFYFIPEKKYGQTLTERTRQLNRQSLLDFFPCLYFFFFQPRTDFVWLIFCYLLHSCESLKISV